MPQEVNQSTKSNRSPPQFDPLQHKKPFAPTPAISTARTTTPPLRQSYSNVSPLLPPPPGPNYLHWWKSTHTPTPFRNSSTNIPLRYLQHNSDYFFQPPLGCFSRTPSTTTSAFLSRTKFTPNHPTHPRPPSQIVCCCL